MQPVIEHGWRERMDSYGWAISIAVAITMVGGPIVGTLLALAGVTPPEEVSRADEQQNGLLLAFLAAYLLIVGVAVFLGVRAERLSGCGSWLIVIVGGLVVDIVVTTLLPMVVLISVSLVILFVWALRRRPVVAARR